MLRKLLLCLVLLVSAFSLGTAQDTKKQLTVKITSEDGLAAKAKWEAAILKADKEAQEAFQKVEKQALDARTAAREAFLADLKKALDALTKAGKLDEAVQIRDAIKQVEKGPASEASDADQPIRNRRLPQAIAGAIFRVNNVDLHFNNKSEFWFSDWKKKGRWHTTSTHSVEGVDAEGKKWLFVFSPDFERAFYVDGNDKGGCPRTR